MPPQDLDSAQPGELPVGLPSRPVLLPGLHVLRRGPAELQVGLDPRRAVVLPATDAVRRTLDVLAVAGPVAGADPGVLARLMEHGLLVEQDARAAVPTRTARVEVIEFGAIRMPGVADLLAGAGLCTAGRCSPPEQHEHRPPRCGLLLGVGEPARDLLDPWVRQEVPHLVLRISEGVALLGPFVEPGRTACLRCIDAHHTDSDPRWPLLVVQQATRTALLRSDGTPEPADAALVRLATAWAVRDLVSHTQGVPPATWSATLRMPPHLAETESVTWLRHPECGCSWNAEAEWAS